MAFLGAAAAQGGEGGSSIRRGGTFRIAVAGPTGNMDPAVLSDFGLLEATCARLMTYPDKPPPEGYRLVPEVASRPPSVSSDGKTYTFTLRSGRSGYRFNNGAPVRPSAFVWAFTRILRVNSTDAVALLQDIVGADRVIEGDAQSVSGLRARGNRLVIRLTRPAPAFPARMSAVSFCAVPPSLPVDPEGVPTFPAAGPYYVATNVRGRSIVLRRNRFYRGPRPHRVDSIVAEGGLPSFDDVLDSVERGLADWGFAPPPLYFDPSRRLAAKYGVNKGRFWVAPGLALDHYPLNTRRRLFRNNPKLRQAVSFAINRAAVRRALGGTMASRLTDQYLPPSLPGFKQARIYPLQRSNLRKARALARGHRRSGKVVLYTFDTPPTLAAAQVIKQNLAQIGLDVDVKGIPPLAYFERIIGNPAEPWDIARAGWAPDHLDPYTYLNLLFDGQFAERKQPLPFRQPDVQPPAEAGGASASRKRLATAHTALSTCGWRARLSLRSRSATGTNRRSSRRGSTRAASCSGRRSSSAPSASSVRRQPRAGCSSAGGGSARSRHRPSRAPLRARSRALPGARRS